MKPSSPLADRLRRHYEVPGLLARIDRGLVAIGEDPERPDPERLAAVDEFHVRGPSATKELLAELAVTAGERVLDVGAGLGGPARTLARHGQATVVAADLSAEFTRTAAVLTRRLGLDELVTHVDTPVETLGAGRPFDAAWTLHVGMNVADKPAFYRAIHRLLRPGGRFLVYDIFRAAGPDPIYPMPWAPTEAESHLTTPGGLAKVLEDVGFTGIERRDDTRAALAFLERTVGAATQGPPPLGLHTVLGPVFREIPSNLLRNLITHALCVARVTARKPDA
ncbi:MAG: methyltransferase domain-containing protein [Alphaproteobacteria bacterium]|nr:methyltransferase domain-containing protein [Alphaproteobacteria bacterium]